MALLDQGNRCVECGGMIAFEGFESYCIACGLCVDAQTFEMDPGYKTDVDGRIIGNHVGAPQGPGLSSIRGSVMWMPRARDMPKTAVARTRLERWKQTNRNN